MNIIFSFFIFCKKSLLNLTHWTFKNCLLHSKLMNQGQQQKGVDVHKLQTKIQRGKSISETSFYVESQHQIRVHIFAPDIIQLPLQPHFSIYTSFICGCPSKIKMFAWFPFFFFFLSQVQPPQTNSFSDNISVKVRESFLGNTES